MIEITEGQVDPRVILGLKLQQRMISLVGHHIMMEFLSMIMRILIVRFMIDDLSTPELLVDRVKRLADEERILRVKGYAVIAGKPMRLLVQAVGNRIRTQYDRMWLTNEPKQGRLVVIAEHDHLNTSAIEKILAG